MTGENADKGRTAVLALASAGVALLAAAALYQISFYLRLPVDLLSHAESPFVNDIIKIRLGEPLYHAPGDNNSYPYSVGTQFLTYAIARLFGQGDSIVALRTVQFGYVVAACGVGVGICHQLTNRFLGRGYPHRALWWLLWASTFVLVALDPRFNAYNHSLHNDGLAVLASAAAFWVLVRYEASPGYWLLVASVLIPVAGFLVKQSLLIWLGLSAAYFWLAGHLRLRQTVLFVAIGAAATALVVALQYAMWGDPYWWWVFVSQGAKSVSPLRSGLHLLEAGGYLILALFAAWILFLRRRPDDPPLRPFVTLWGVWLCLFLVEAYTSGLGWVVNHLGPGVFLATCWFLVAACRVWKETTVDRPGDRQRPFAWPGLARAAILATSLVCVPGVLDLVRVPENPVPPDFQRYVDEIETAFEGLPADQVLLDNGSWIYLREGVLMKDRSSVVGIHAGPNQDEISREYLTDTIDRIRSGEYARILTRELHSARSPYDFQNRGTGVREAILETYREVGRIEAVQGVAVWWPLNLISEISILEPR